MLKNVYLTSLGAFLPGSPVSNEEAEDYLGRVGGKPSRARARILKQNGIQFRHYAIDKNQRSLYRSSQMAALAVRDALGRRNLPLDAIDFLAAATTQGDLCVPGFASMVHGELKNPACEIASLHGVCASGMMALKSAYLQIRAGEKQMAIACASEFPSRLFKASRFDAQLGRGESLSFDTEFLRWMLSDGAGAAVLENAPRAGGRSLRVEWISLQSHANEHQVCMLAGANQGPDGSVGPSWLDYPSFEAASREGALNLKQDIRLLDRVVQMGVDGYLALIEQGHVDPRRLDWMVCHYSSDFFREKIFTLLRKAGLVVNESQWFTNLRTKGNVGCASAFVQLEELFHSDRLRDGQQILVVVPESGRFITSYVLLTVIGESSAPLSVAAPSVATLAGPPEIRVKNEPRLQQLVTKLARVWLEFESKLHRVPIVSKLESGQFALEDYRALLINLRQQVVEGGRWIARAASSIDAELFPLRSAFIQHAGDEHGDFKMIERDFQSLGGTLEEITQAPKNIGSEALSAWMFHRAGQPNPIDLIGAMFIIEGLGIRLARGWGELIRNQLNLSDAEVSFLLYHGQNDDQHLSKLETALEALTLTDSQLHAIVKTAKVTARLYLLQLEEIGNV